MVKPHILLKKIGTSPIQASGIEYEFDVAGELDYTHILTISKSRCPAITDKTYLNPGQEFTEELLTWLATSQEPQTTTDKSFEPQLPKLPNVPSQDLRVKQIRTLLNYPVELVVEWLKFQEVERPNQLQPNQVDELVKTMCLSWAQDKFEHPNHAADSYHQNVVNAVANRIAEIDAIKAWMGNLSDRKMLNHA